MISSLQSTNSNSSNSQQVKQVSFLSVATVRIVENYKLTLATPKARAKVWYTARELATFKRAQEQQQLTAEAEAILQQRFGAPQQNNNSTCTRLRIDRRIPAREAYALRRQQQQKQQQCTPTQPLQQQQQQQRRRRHQHQHPMYRCQDSKNNKTNKTKTSLSSSSSLRSSRGRFSGNRRGRLVAWPTITTRRS